VNIDYEPEQFGLEKLHDLDRSTGVYEYDRMLILRDTTTGAIFTAEDSGCSCPTPFEGMGRDDLSEVKPGEWAAFEKSFREWCAASPEYSDWPGIDAVTQAEVLHDLKTRLEVFA
jgi:hypothetical protein